MPPAPLAVAGFMVAGVAAWQYSDRPAGLLACWVLLSGFCFASTLCWSVCWLVGFWMSWLGQYSDRLVGFCCLVFVLLVLSVGVFAGSLFSGC